MTFNKEAVSIREEERYLKHLNDDLEIMIKNKEKQKFIDSQKKLIIDQEKFVEELRIQYDK